MPIREMLKRQEFLEPKETAVLCEVFEDVLKTLRIVDRQDVLTTLIARKLVELARAGERDSRGSCARAKAQMEPAASKAPKRKWPTLYRPLDQRPRYPLS